MRRPNAPQRELLRRLDGDGFPRADLTRLEMRKVYTLHKKGWADYAYPREEQGDYRNCRWFTTDKGRRALQAPAPPPPPGRVGCVNPMCGKTADQNKFPGCDAIICGACFRKIPELRHRYRQLWARRRKIERGVARRGFDAPAALQIIDRQINQNWRDIVAAFQETDRPEGIEEFINEIGLADPSEENESGERR